MKSFFQGIAGLAKAIKDISGVIWWFLGLTGVSTTFLIQYWQSPALSWSVGARPLLVIALVVAICVFALMKISFSKDAKIRGLESLVSIEREKNAARPPLCKSDVDLGQKMEMHFDRSIYTFLREQDIGAPFVRECLNPIFEYSDTWKGPHFEFVDTELEESRLRFRKAMTHFSHELAIHTTCNGRFVSMGISDYTENDPDLLKKRDELNEEGHDVADLLEDFIRIFRKRRSESEK